MAKSYRLSRKGLAALRAAIRRTKPWTRATGPRTEAGKLRSRLNARTHGRCSRAAKLAEQYKAAERRWFEVLCTNAYDDRPYTAMLKAKAAYRAELRRVRRALGRSPALGTMD